MTSNREKAAEILHRHHDNCNEAADAHAETEVTDGWHDSE